MLGGLNQHESEIQKMVTGMRNITIHKNINFSQIVAILSQTHLAIGAGGMSIYERCRFGIPSLVITLAENQEQNAKNLQDAHAIVWLGSKDTWTREDLLKWTFEYYRDFELWGKSRRACWDVVDGHGARRIIERVKF